MRPDVDSTQFIPRAAWQNPRVHLLDDIWLMTLVAILVATGIPWFLSGFQVDVGPATWGLLALGAVHFGFTLLAAPARSHGRWRDRLLTLLNVAGVMLLGFIWLHVGALQNPMFLMLFGLPVIGAIFLTRWHPFFLAVVSVCVVGAAAFSQAPELQWYASGLAGGVFGSHSWVAGLFANRTSVVQPSFAGFYAPSSYMIVLLEVFAIALFACATAAEYLGTIFERLSAHSIVARTEAARAQDLWLSLIEQLPLPALLVDPDTLKIVAASDLGVTQLALQDTPPAGRDLFEALRFSYPDIIRELINGVDGGAPMTAIRIADQLRLTQVRVLHVAHKGHRLALLTLEDATEAFCLKAALDTSEYAALVVDARGRILTFNKLARGLFGSVAAGIEAAKLLPQAAGAQRWWESGVTGRRKSHIEIGPRIYQVTSSAIAMAGEEERIFTVSFLPVAVGGTADPYSAGSTVLTSTLRQLR